MARWAMVLMFCGVLPLSAALAAVDPTRPYGSMGASTGFMSIKQANLKLSSLILSPRRKVAIINNKVLQVGDVIAGKTITAIDAKGVTLHDETQEQPITLTLFSVKSPR